MSRGRNTVTMSVNTSGLDALLTQIGDDVTKAARPAAQAAATVLQEAARSNVRNSDKGHWFHGTSFKKTGKKYWFEPGTLRQAIYQVYSKTNSNEQQGVATYHVSWNYKKAPYGFMVEYGTSRAPARPFIRPAASKGSQALQAAETELLKRVTA